GNDLRFLVSGSSDQPALCGPMPHWPACWTICRCTARGNSEGGGHGLAARWRVMRWISAAQVARILGVARSTAATGLALLEAGRPWRGIRLPRECVTRTPRPGARADGALMILASALPK